MRPSVHLAAAAALLALAAPAARAQRVTTGVFGAVSYAPATSEKAMGAGLALGLPLTSRFGLEFELAEMLGSPAAPEAAAGAAAPAGTAAAMPKSATIDYHAHGTFDIPLGPRATAVVGPGVAFSANTAAQNFGASLVTGLAVRVTRLAVAQFALVTDHFAAAPSFVQTVHMGLKIGWHFSPVAEEREADEPETPRATKPAARAAAKPAPRPAAKPAPKPAPRPAPKPAAKPAPVDAPADAPADAPSEGPAAPAQAAAPVAAPVEAPAAPAVSAVDSAAVARPIFFGTGSAALDANAMQTLREKAAVLARYPDANLRVVGHTDVRGGRAMNEALAMQRARAVRDALRKLGVDDARLVAEGEGSAHPAAAGRDAASLAQNRRSELVLHVGPVGMPACVAVPAGADAEAKARAAADGRPACVAKRYY